MSEASREQRARRRLKPFGYFLRKSRFRNPELVAYYGGYRIVSENNVVVAGERFDLTLDDVERWME
jgi:hypothetical protein